jgi:hypothetical protein
MSNGFCKVPPGEYVMADAVNLLYAAHHDDELLATAVADRVKDWEQVASHMAFIATSLMKIIDQNTEPKTGTVLLDKISDTLEDKWNAELAAVDA